MLNMIQVHSFCIALIGLIVSTGLALVGIMFKWLRGDILMVGQKLDNHTTFHLEGQA